MAFLPLRLALPVRVRAEPEPGGAAQNAEPRGRDGKRRAKGSARRGRGDKTDAEETSARRRAPRNAALAARPRLQLAPPRLRDGSAGGGSEGRGGTPSGARGRGCGSRVFGVTFQLSAPFEGSAALGCPNGPRPYAYVCPIVPKRNRAGAERSERGTAAHRSARQPRGTRQSGRRRAPQRSRLRSRQHREDGFGTTVGRLWEGGRSGPRLPRGPREAAASSPAERPQHCAPGNGAGGVCFSSPVRLGT